MFYVFLLRDTFEDVDCVLSNVWCLALLRVS